MKIIGKIIKGTNAITYKRSLKKKVDFDSQLSTLMNLLWKAKKTAFGKRYSFGNMIKSKDVYDQFRMQIPIVDYDEFYEEWLVKSLNGEKDVIWPGKIKHYALSSGTTGSPSKRIPVTLNMIRSFQMAGIRQFSTLHNLNLSESFYQAQFLVVGGSTELVKLEHYVEGDLSGILKKYASYVAAPFTKPGRKITKEKDWNKKFQMMVEDAPNWNIGIIGGVPSWCISLMEKIIEHYNLNSIHDIWPNLEVYVHGGVFMDPYIDRLNAVVEKPIVLLDTYLASEGYFAYQKEPNKKGMQLLLNSGVFFEFVPFTSDYFDKEGQLLNKQEAFNIDEVQPGMDYAVVVSTNAGLWRYMIGDLVRFTDIEQREIVITGRIKQFLSICGEHISLDNINQAIQYLNTTTGANITEFTITAEPELYHHWYLGVEGVKDGDVLIQVIDKALREGNDDYHSARKYNLKDPKVTLLPVDQFYKFMESKGKLGSQNKFPRVLNQKQREDWLSFIHH